MNVHEAYAKWNKIEELAGDVEGAAEALIVLRLYAHNTLGGGDIVAAVDKLSHCYREYGGDLDGEATMALHEAYAEWDKVK